MKGPRETARDLALAHVVVTRRMRARIRRQLADATVLVDLAEDLAERRRTEYLESGEY